MWQVFMFEVAETVPMTYAEALVQYEFTVRRYPTARVSIRKATL